jgi:adenylate cyclase
MLERLSMPTLLIFRPGVREYREELPREIASRIPKARSAFLDGTTYAWYVYETDKLVATIDAFLAEHEPKPEPETVAPEAVGPQGLTSDTHVVLFTDIEGSSALASRYGDDHAHEVRRAHDRIVREALNQFRGREVKHTGDGIMAAFGMASSGIDCAVNIQRAIAAYNHEHEKYPLSVYIGLNAGEPIAENEDLFGTSVDLAARICDYANAGQILISDVVRQLVAGKRYMFADHGHSDIRGMEEPIRLWEVRWQEEEAE